MARCHGYTQNLSCGCSSLDHTRTNHQASNQGFTLIELLVSSVILVVAVVGSIAAFNVITQSVRVTGLTADRNRRIDRDIAEISRISEVYTSCIVPAGSVPADPENDCTGTDVVVGNSFYYFPDPALVNFLANRQAFFDACRTNDASGHITNQFIAAIAALPQPGAGVQRNQARAEPGNGANHLVRITWVDTQRANRELRSMQTVPVVSSWCP